MYGALAVSARTAICVRLTTPERQPGRRTNEVSSQSYDPEPSLLLARAVNEEQVAAIGRQSGGRVFLFLSTDDFWRDYNAMLAAGVEFVREPKTEPYGTVAVFRDVSGNLWDLFEPASKFPPE